MWTKYLGRLKEQDDLIGTIILFLSLSLIFPPFISRNHSQMDHRSRPRHDSDAEFVLSILPLVTCLTDEALERMENMIRGHVEDPENSVLKRLIPGLGDPLILHFGHNFGKTLQAACGLRFL